MLKQLFKINDYFHYLLSARNLHGIHSPFVFEFTKNIIYGKQSHPVFPYIEQCRRSMIKSDTKINFEDFGAGKKSGIRSLSEITNATSKQRKYGELLYRILQYLQPTYAIELGTSTGISALYQTAAISLNTFFYTVEGSSKLAEIARFNAKQCGLEDRMIVVHGLFDIILPEFLLQVPHIDYAYIDGNHSFEPTLRYFDLLLPKCTPNTILIFDDIYWSEEMKRAWSIIKNHERVSLTLDLFNFGLVFFRAENKEKEHFTIRY